MVKNRVVKLLFSLCIALTAARAEAVALPEKDTGNLGEIRQSILSVENFQRIYGDGWELMQGQSAEAIRTSDLVTEGLWPENQPLPDARGVFLRSKNHTRPSDQGNTAGDQPIGFAQPDQFKNHNHGGGNHTHPLDLWQPTGPEENHIQLQRTTAAYFDNAGGYIKHSGCIIAPEGGSETRPRCITVNTFIKVNRTVVNQQTNKILEAIQELPTRMSAHPQWAGMVRRIVQQEQKNKTKR